MQTLPKLAISLAAAAAFTLLAFGSDEVDESADIEAMPEVPPVGAAIDAAPATPPVDADEGLYGSAPDADDSIYGSMMTAPEVAASQGLYGEVPDADDSIYGSTPGK